MPLKDPVKKQERDRRLRQRPRRSPRAAFMYPVRPRSARAWPEGVPRLCRISAAPPSAPAVRRPGSRGCHTPAAIRNGAAEPTAPATGGGGGRGRKQGCARHAAAAGRRRAAPSASRAARPDVPSIDGAIPREKAAHRCVRCGQRTVGGLSRCGRCLALEKGARLSGAKERRREETLCRKARAGRVCGLWSPHRWPGPL